jgi:hypothetical protein
MLKGESRFHISTFPGDWTQVLHDRKKWVDQWTSGTVYECSEIAGSPQYWLLGGKRVDHWNSGTVYECSEIAGSPQGSPPMQPTISVVKEDLQQAWNTGQKSCVRSSGIITLSAWRSSGGLGKDRLRQGHNDQSHQDHRCTDTMLTGESRFHISTPLGIEPGSFTTGRNGWTTGQVELCMNAVRLQALHSIGYWAAYALIWFGSCDLPCTPRVAAPPPTAPTPASGSFSL